MASWRSTMAPPSARTAVSPLAVATGCFSAAIRAAKRLRCCEASSRLATAAVLSPSPGSATCCPEFRRTPSRGLVNYCPTAGNRSLVQPRSELRLYHSIHATGMRFTSRLLGLSFQDEIKKKLDETDTLVVIDSAVLKPAFGYTGMELGYFISVMGRDLDPEFSRRIVPIYLDKPPDILAGHEGIKIDISHDTLSMTFEEYEACLGDV